MTKRLALLIGNNEFSEPETFLQLRTPVNDVLDLSAILREHGNFEIVNTLLDKNSDTIKKAIENFYNLAERGDLTLLYYSGHGYRDKGGRLYLAARDTQTSQLLSTGVREQFIHDAMSYSRSRHRVVVLDCCFSGAFIKGKKSGTEPLLLEKLKGEASAVLASSGTIQYSFEEEGRNSLFTRYLAEGIATGEADEDKDGVISLEELFGYVDPRVRGKRPEQTPMIEISTRGSQIFIAKNPNPVVTVQLPPELTQAIESPLSGVRAGAVTELEHLLSSSDKRIASAAMSALKQLADDDSRRVSTAAAKSLSQYSSPQRVPGETGRVLESKEQFERTVAPAPASSDHKVPDSIRPHTLFRRLWRVGALLIFPIPIVPIIGGISYAQELDSWFIVLTIVSLIPFVIGIEHLTKQRRSRGWLLILVSLGWIASAIEASNRGELLRAITSFLSIIAIVWAIIDAIRNEAV